ncbi:MAG: biotin--[Oscillospiraceae bacterium]|nr:biotin--[acetyl-CoA-carboxylase] ligase [Oscillospiraceae bacterium]
MTKDNVLILLKDAEGYISGEDIARELRLSRVSVNKAVASLISDGYEISSVFGRGYRLVSSPDLLTLGEIASYLGPEHRKTHLTVFETIDSTNTYLKQHFEEFGDLSCVVADCQTGGRGRRGRTFMSPPRTGIYMSFIFKPDREPYLCQDFTGYMAVAVSDGIKKCCGLDPQIKWTNDIIMGDLKVSGILTEIAVESESRELQYLISGIGINVNQTASDFPEELSEIAGSISMAAGHKIRRAELCACVIESVHAMYDAWLSGDRSYVKRYAERCITCGREVKVLKVSGDVTGYAVGIDDEFGLIVRYADGSEETIRFGEVSVRGLYGYR